ncbi:MAG: hypothetical protein KF752_17825 [Pirellulaceae bacterium]|nr:hypothetical protein [Pirellulaceae bacterium]
MTNKELNSIERDLLEGMEWLVDKLKQDKPFTCRRLVLNLEPQEYTPEQVKATRKILQLSQALFAEFLGFSRNSVCAWEQGKKSPPDAACRFMDEIQRNPDYFRRRVSDSLEMKQVNASAK